MEADFFNKKLIEAPIGPGLFIEAGAGGGTSHFLMCSPGASAIVFDVHIPYSRRSQATKYGECTRSVSQETVINWAESSLNTWLIIDRGMDIRRGSTPEFAFASSVSLHTKLTHGWICITRDIQDELKSRAYHFSLRDCSKRSRSENIELIGRIGASLLVRNLVDFTFWDASLGYIDIAPTLSEMADLGSNPEHKSPFILEPVPFNSENPLPNSSGPRYEDVVRGNEKGTTIMRGSFRPLTRAHSVMAETHKAITDRKVLYAISCKNFEPSKPNLTGVEIMDRARALTSHPDIKNVLFLQGPFFDDTFKELGEDELSFLVGGDTARRILENRETAQQTLSKGTLYYLSREGHIVDDPRFIYQGDAPRMSSTEARAGDISMLHPQVASYVSQCTAWLDPA